MTTRRLAALAATAVLAAGPLAACGDSSDGSGASTAPKSPSKVSIKAAQKNGTAATHACAQLFGGKGEKLMQWGGSSVGQDPITGTPTDTGFSCEARTQTETPVSVTVYNSAQGATSDSSSNPSIASDTFSVALSESGSRFDQPTAMRHIQSDVLPSLSA